MLREVAETFPSEEAWAKSVSRERLLGKKWKRGRKNSILYRMDHIFQRCMCAHENTNENIFLLPSLHPSFPAAQASCLGGGLAALRGMECVSGDEGLEGFEGDSSFDYAGGTVI